MRVQSIQQLINDIATGAILLILLCPAVFAETHGILAPVFEVDTVISSQDWEVASHSKEIEPVFAQVSYATLTEQTLLEAYQSYQQDCALGMPTVLAESRMSQRLAETGLDAKAAAELLKQIQSGDYSVDGVVERVLTTISQSSR